MAEDDINEETRSPYEIAKARLEENRTVAMRANRLNSKPLSTMPVTSTGTHALYTQLASLQMSKARQTKIRDALLDQIARCEEEIARVEAQSAILKDRIEKIDAKSPSRRTVQRGRPPRQSNTEIDTEETAASLEEAFHFKY